MAGSASSSTETKRKAEETPVREFEERDLTDQYMENLFEDVPYSDPIHNDQNDNIDLPKDTIPPEEMSRSS